MADVETSIYRPANDTDRRYFEVDLRKKSKTPQEKFEHTLGEKELEATKKKLPFAKFVAREDFNGAIDTQKREQLRKYGKIEFPEKVLVPVTDWDKYSDLKNFELIEEGTVFDSHLTKENPGLRVSIKKKTYQFKGYGQKYIIMQDGPDAVKEAQEKTWKQEKHIKS